MIKFPILSSFIPFPHPKPNKQVKFQNCLWAMSSALTSFLSILWWPLTPNLPHGHFALLSFYSLGFLFLVSIGGCGFFAHQITAQNYSPVKPVERTLLSLSLPSFSSSFASDQSWPNHIIPAATKSQKWPKPSQNMGPQLPSHHLFISPLNTWFRLFQTPLPIQPFPKSFLPLLPPFPLFFLRSSRLWQYFASGRFAATFQIFPLIPIQSNWEKYILLYKSSLTVPRLLRSNKMSRPSLRPSLGEKEISAIFKHLRLSPNFPPNSFSKPPSPKLTPKMENSAPNSPMETDEALIIDENIEEMDDPPPNGTADPPAPNGTADPPPPNGAAMPSTTESSLGPLPANSPAVSLVNPAGSPDPKMPGEKIKVMVGGKKSRSRIKKRSRKIPVVARTQILSSGKIVTLPLESKKSVPAATIALMRRNAMQTKAHPKTQHPRIVPPSVNAPNVPIGGKKKGEGWRRKPKKFTNLIPLNAITFPKGAPPPNPNIPPVPIYPNSPFAFVAPNFLPKSFAPAGVSHSAINPDFSHPPPPLPPSTSSR